MNRRGFMKLLALTPLVGLLKPKKTLPKKVEPKWRKFAQLPYETTSLLDQRQTLGWKVIMTSKILNNDPISILNVTA